MAAKETKTDRDRRLEEERITAMKRLNRNKCLMIVGEVSQRGLELTYDRLDKMLEKGKVLGAIVDPQVEEWMKANPRPIENVVAPEPAAPELEPED